MFLCQIVVGIEFKVYFYFRGVLFLYLKSLYMRLLNKVFYITAISLLLLFISMSASSQKYFFSNYGIKEGLAHSQIKDIAQDSNGYVWIGTKIGLSRFDGERFTNFSKEDGIAASGVNAICVDNSGNMWLGHFFGGLTLYRNGEFCEIILDSIKNDITNIVQDEKNQIWIATNGDGVYLISDPSADKIIVNEHYTAKENLGNIIFSMSTTESLGMMFVTRYGVKFMNEKTNEWELVDEQFYAWPQYFNIIKVYEDSKKGVWIGTFNGGLYYYKDIDTKPIIYDKRDGLANNWVGEIVEDNDGSIWAGTWGGGISNINKGKILSLNESNGLSENKVKSIYVDFEGNVLIGTYSSGLSVFKSFAFVHYSKFIENKPIQVNAVYEDDKTTDIWLGTNDGIFQLEGIKEGRYSIVEYKKDNFGLQSNDIRFLRSDGKNLWIGTYGGGVSVMDLETNKIIYVYRINSLLQQSSRFENVSAMDVDSEGHVWVGSPGGLIYYEPETDQANILTQGNNLQSNDISTIYCDDENTVWIGHLGKGITKIIGSEITRYDINEEYTPAVIYGNGSELFVGTEGKGMYIYSDGVEKKHFTMATGLISDMVIAIQKDGDGNIFCGTNNGLSRIDKKLYEVNSYGEKKGFEGVEIMHEALYFGSKYLWAGTAIGFTKVRTELLIVDEKPPVTFVTKLRINLEEIDKSSNISLKHNENAILIDYKAICISEASSVVYKVRLLGAEKEWQPETKQTYANFPALPSGDYVFEVKAKNNSGVWNDTPQTVVFTINPPFWQTLWFISLVLIVTIVSVVVFVKYREKSLLKEKAELENKVQERTVEIREKNGLLAQKNKDIMDSINYARRIQRAIMPTKTKMEELLKSSFIYYKPKDIVSGDFHWNTLYKDRLIIAAADCTGHGVPGAFMSMISISSLNKVVKEKQITDPARILDNVRHDIVNDLKQSGEQAKDGLDIALLSIDVDKGLVHYAGAYNSMYIIRKDKIDESALDYDFAYSIFGDNMLEVKADRMPIGISERMDRNFTTKTVQMHKGDKLYISTDGYIDQFGGEKGKKFMSKRFKKLLLEMPFNNEGDSLEILDKRFTEWRGEHEQIDDVLVIGICF